MQGSIVAFVGVPSFVVTLGGFLIWQGVILNKLEQRGHDHHPGPLDQLHRQPTSSRTFAGYLIAAILTALYPISILYKLVVARGTQIAQQNWTIVGIKAVGIGVAAFGTVAIANHGEDHHDARGAAARRRAHRDRRSSC